MGNFLSKYKWYIIIVLVILLVIWLIWKYGKAAGALDQATTHPTATVVNPYVLPAYGSSTSGSTA